MLTLVQFVGDHTVSVDFPHGNAKKNNMPYSWSAPSLIRELEVGSEKPAKEYQKKVFEVRLFQTHLPRGLKYQGILTKSGMLVKILKR